MRRSQIFSTDMLIAFLILIVIILSISWVYQYSRERMNLNEQTNKLLMLSSVALSTLIETEGNPPMTGIFGARTETNLYPIIINLFKDPREQWNLTADHAFIVGPYLQIIGAYKKSVIQYPVPKPFSMTKF